MQRLAGEANDIGAEHAVQFRNRFAAGKTLTEVVPVDRGGQPRFHGLDKVPIDRLPGDAAVVLQLDLPAVRIESRGGVDVEPVPVQSDQVLMGAVGLALERVERNGGNEASLKSAFGNGSRNGEGDGSGHARSLSS